MIGACVKNINHKYDIGVEIKKSLLTKISNHCWRLLAERVYRNIADQTETMVRVMWRL